VGSGQHPKLFSLWLNSEDSPGCRGNHGLPSNPLSHVHGCRLAAFSASIATLLRKCVEFEGFLNIREIDKVPGLNELAEFVFAKLFLLVFRPQSSPWPPRSTFGGRIACRNEVYLFLHAVVLPAATMQDALSVLNHCGMFELAQRYFSGVRRRLRSISVIARRRCLCFLRLVSGLVVHCGSGSWRFSRDQGMEASRFPLHSTTRILQMIRCGFGCGWTYTWRRSCSASIRVLLFVLGPSSEDCLSGNLTALFRSEPRRPHCAALGPSEFAKCHCVWILFLCHGRSHHKFKQ
jgi:hypothetical protein